MKLRRREYGGMLILGMILLGTITLLGLILLQRLQVDTEVAMASSQAEKALQIAEAGLQHAITKLGEKLDASSGDFTEVLAEATISTAECGSNCPLEGWIRAISGEDRISYNGGYYIAGIKDDEGDETDTTANKRIIVRSLGVSAEGKLDSTAVQHLGSIRMVEAIVEYAK